MTLPLPRVYGWLLLYVLMWSIGGLVMFAVIGLFEPLDMAALPVVIGAWSISATVSLLTFFLPSGLGVMELTLVALLSPVLSPGAAVLAALAARLLVTLFDVGLGLAVYALTAASYAE